MRMPLRLFAILPVQRFRTAGQPFLTNTLAASYQGMQILTYAATGTFAAVAVIVLLTFEPAALSRCGRSLFLALEGQGTRSSETVGLRIARFGTRKLANIVKATIKRSAVGIT